MFITISLKICLGNSNVVLGKHSYRSSKFAMVSVHMPNFESETMKFSSKRLLKPNVGNDSASKNLNGSLALRKDMAMCIPSETIVRKLGFACFLQFERRNGA